MPRACHGASAKRCKVTRYAEIFTGEPSWLATHTRLGFLADCVADCLEDCLEDCLADLLAVG